MPGTYTVRLSAADKILSVPLEIRPDPRWKISAEEFARQDEMLAAIERDVTELNHDVVIIRSIRDQIDTVLKRPGTDPVSTSGKELAGKLQQVEDVLIQRNPSGGQRAVVEPSRFSSYFNFLHVSINQVIPELTEGQRVVYLELSKEFDGYKTQLARLLGADLEAFNQLLARQEIAPIVPPK